MKQLLTLLLLSLTIFTVNLICSQQSVSRSSTPMDDFGIPFITLREIS